MGGVKPPVLTDHGIQLRGLQLALSAQDFGFVLNVLHQGGQFDLVKEPVDCLERNRPEACRSGHDLRQKLLRVVNHHRAG